MFVTATTNCFRGMPLEQALEKIADLEYSHVELMFHESNDYLKPSVVVNSLNETLTRLKNLHRLMPVAFSLDIETNDDDVDEYVRQFVGIMKLARAMQVLTLTVRAASRNSFFNVQVERLRKCVAEATRRGVIVGLLTEHDRLTEDVETCKSLCRLVPGLSLTLDPSHFMYKSNENVRLNMESLLGKVCHVRLRDTKVDKFQVCVGQGEMEFGQLISKLESKKYRGSLSVDILPEENIDTAQEMRKMRLLLESLL